MRRSTVHNRKTALKAVKELDAFPKIRERYVEDATASGATISIASFVLIIVFVLTEIRYYTTSRVKFKYDVDLDFDSKLKINIDMTVAMPCETIGADILDVTNQNANSFGQLQEERTWFQLSPRQRLHWDSMKQVNAYIRQQSHAIQDLLWTSGYDRFFNELPKREVAPTGEPDACRLYGSLLVNKVAGNFHITAGKSIIYPRGHAHLAAFLGEEDYNFTHRIDKFSFGEQTVGLVNPLDGDEKIASKNFQIFQYFVQVVPTEVNTFTSKVSTYQFSVTEQEREINHMKGSHGVPGIFVKYDMSSIKVKVIEEYEPIGQFIIRLCGIVGGIISTSGLLNLIIGWIVDCLCCQFMKGNKSTVSASQHHKPSTQVLAKPLIDNDIIHLSQNGAASLVLPQPVSSGSSKNDLSEPQPCLTTPTS